MKFKMNKVAIAVTASLGVSLVGMNVAQSDEVLFPYVVASPTVTTILSVINDGDNVVFDEMHYRYYTKSGVSAESKTASCVEVDARRVSSMNDVVSFDVNEAFSEDGALGVLFEDATNQINADYTGANQNFALLRNIDEPVRGFAIVDNNDFLSRTNFPSLSQLVSPSRTVTSGDTEQAVHGEAIIIEFGSGAAWGYKAFNAAGIYGSTNGGASVLRLNPYDFSDRVEVNGEVVTSRVEGNNLSGGVATTLLPFDEFSTRLFVTPVSSFQLSGSISATVSFNIEAEVADLSNDVMFDRDENPVSGRVPMTVTCIGALDAQKMLTQGALGEVPDGGWTNVRVEDGQAIVVKLEFNDTTNSFNLPGAFNNAVWLRSGFRETLAREYFNGTSPILNAEIVGPNYPVIAANAGRPDLLPFIGTVNFPFGDAGSRIQENFIPVYQIGEDINSPCPILDLNGPTIVDTNNVAVVPSRAGEDEPESIAGICAQ